MVIFPRAKINIGLRITGKRPDGFHNIETIFYPVCLCDAIEFIDPELPLENDILEVTGILPDKAPANNLVMKAVRKIREIKQIPFLKLHLHKAIPVGAGLGGGSSDAATLIKSLNRHFNLEISNEKMKEIIDSERESLRIAFSHFMSPLLSALQARTARYMHILL